MSHEIMLNALIEIFFDPFLLVVALVSSLIIGLEVMKAVMDLVNRIF